MTSIPVKDVGFGTAGSMTTGVKSALNGGFQEIWNSRTDSDAGKCISDDSAQPVKKTPGDSLKARDEHRARTEKREPGRNVEERADIPKEKLEEAAEVLATAAAEMVGRIAGIMGVEVEVISEKLEELGMMQTDVLNSESLSELILAVAGAEDASVLVTDETLYGDYRELMTRLENVLEENAAALEQSPEQISDLLEQLGNGKNVPAEMHPEITVEITGDRGDFENTVRTADSAGEDVAESSDVFGQKEDTGTESIKPRTSPEPQGDNGNNSNQLFQQGLSTEQAETQIQQTASAESAWTTDTENIMRQIMDYMKINLKSDISSMEMQLHPASLGTLQVQVASKGGVLTASFVTQNEAVKAALESQMVQLKNQFEEQGVKVDAIEVTVQTHEFERNLDQGRGNNSRGQEPSRRGRIRRLNLNEPVMAEELEEEERLAKNIMEANGSTVDYSA